ncbi:hypothetical protein [Desulfovibrio sp. UCD-KL4C]|uniref:hypothetical protein n=1 Tax=Desulfovibrio sp. UCD-KL4C TaxID=2578120 RepID=UPI0025BF09F1|nr:hypothetical protein [Desulfovibrio sp. UCD-KL4C]
MKDLQTQLTEHLPPVFAATSLDILTGNALRWRTIQNMRANKEIPEADQIPAKCFLLDGKRKVLIVRDPFLTWWLNRLTPQNTHIKQ